MIDKKSKILIVGHNDIIENALVGYFQTRGFEHIFSSSALFLDTLDQEEVATFFQSHRPEYVFLSSVRSGGIAANRNMPAEFMYSNLMSEVNIIHNAYTHQAKKLLYVGSSCAYPKETSQPIREESLLTGPLEPTSEPYAVAKIAGIKMCQAYRCQYGFPAIVGIPATVYGPEADVNIEAAHVLAAVVAKVQEAKKNNDRRIVLWGTGRPYREFLFADDFAAAAVYLMEHYDDDQAINIAGGTEISIRELAELIAKIFGFQGEIVFDGSKPDGAMRKLLDHSRIAQLGWHPSVSLEEGLRKIYSDARKPCS